MQNFRGIKAIEVREDSPGEGGGGRVSCKTSWALRQ